LQDEETQAPPGPRTAQASAEVEGSVGRFDGGDDADVPLNEDFPGGGVSVLRLIFSADG